MSPRAVSQAAFAETAGFYRVDASLKLNPEKRAVLGQYMTPTPIGRFMASLFSDLTEELHILDPGAGVGSLTAALIERLCDAAVKPDSVELVAYEIEPLLIEYLRNTLATSRLQCQRAHIKSECAVCENDFVLRQPANQAGIFGATDSSVDDAFS